jgi:Tfp pilus assembly protein PilN
MRAINLVPAESRQGRVNGGKSGGAVFGFLGLLAVLVLGASVFAMSKRNESQANQDLAKVEQSTQAYTQVASQFASFETAAKQATDRIATVRSLADARFDWAGSMRDLARVVPADTRVSALSASVDPSSGAGGSSSTFRGSLPVPAIGITGCSLSQLSIARLVTNLQAMRRVTNVTLESSGKDAVTATTPSKKLDDVDGCSDYTFTIDIFFAAGKAQSSKTAVPSATPASSIATESVNGGAVPSTTPATATTTTASTTPTTPASTTPGK